MLGLDNYLNASLVRHRGLFFGEEHGDATHTDFVRNHIPTFMRSGAKTFYFEIVPANENWRLQEWQNSGNTNPINEWLSSQTLAFSDDMWFNYVRLMEELNNAGIRIVGIDDRSLSRGEESNFFWAQIIEEDQLAHPGKFIGYGGRAHLRFDDDGIRSTPIHRILDVPGFYLKTSTPDKTPILPCTQTYSVVHLPSKNRSQIRANLQRSRAAQIPSPFMA